jgi:hypothetical protein
MRSRYRVAIVGAGIGVMHNGALQAHPELFEVALLCDVDPERARRLAEAVPDAAICAVGTRARRRRHRRHLPAAFSARGCRQARPCSRQARGMRKAAGRLARRGG